MFTYLFDGFLRRVFSLLRADGILYIHNALAWRHRSYLSKILSAFLTRSLGIRSRVLSWRPHLQNWFSFPLFLLTEEGATSALSFWPIISLFSSFPWSQSANICWLSFCRLSVRTTISLTRARSWNTDRLTHILYFLRQADRNWPTLLFPFQRSVLGVLLIQTLRDSSNSLFLSSKWENTWQYTYIHKGQHIGRRCTPPKKPWTLIRFDIF